MANTTIEVTVRSSVIEPGPARYCAVVITNCDAMHIDSKRQKINGIVPARFTNVPPGRYYIVVVPEGGNARRARFRVIDGTSAVTSVKFNLSAINPTGKITAIVLVGGLPAPGKTVMIKGTVDGLTEFCMTRSDGVAEFAFVPETQAYDVIAFHGPARQDDVCNLAAGADCAKQFSF